MTLLERLLTRLNLQASATGIFIGGAGAGGVTDNDRLFGGLVAAQATMAALRTVNDFPLHSLHAYFLRPGRPDADIKFHVSHTKEGSNFKARSVAAWQNEELIFQLQASFQRPVEDGLTHTDPMPNTPAPDTLPNRDQLRGRSNWQDMPVDVRMATDITADEPLPPEQAIWLKVNGALPEDPNLHLAMLVYASDRSLLDTAFRPHADQGSLTGASLDHSMWFHQPPRFDDWVLYSMQSPAAAGGRGLAFGAMFNAAGERLVTVAQEGVLRVRPQTAG